MNTTDWIIIAVLVVILALALIGSIRVMRSERCCSSDRNCESCGRRMSSILKNSDGPKECNAPYCPENDCCSKDKD